MSRSDISGESAFDLAIPSGHIDVLLRSARRQEIGRASWGRPFWVAFWHDLEAERKRQIRSLKFELSEPVRVNHRLDDF